MADLDGLRHFFDMSRHSLGASGTTMVTMDRQTNSADPLEDLRRALGRQLAALRRASGHSQHSLAPLTLYGRSTVANVETGRQNAPRDFWIRCDEALGSDGALLAGYDRLSGAIRAQDRITAAEWARSQEATGEAMRRRAVFEVAGAAAIVAATSPGQIAGLRHLAAALMTDEAHLGTSEVPSFPALTERMSAVKRQYQACRYAMALAALPELLNELASADAAVAGKDQERIAGLTAGAY
jgi:hypothetical protein